jgi:outer membrane protein assembly factor BamB
MGDWPALGRTNNHTGVATDPAMTPAKAAKLGVLWMTNLHAADLGSPIAAYEPTLKKLVVYSGNERGDVFAVDGVTGATIWSTNIGVGLSERDSPLYVGGALFIGTAYNPFMVKLDAATGKVLCSSRGPAPFLSSPMAATPPGGQPMYFTATIDEPGVIGPEYGMHQADCSQVWKFTKWVQASGPWASPSYGIDKNGQPLVVVGTADIDSKEYANNALTGAESWVFKIANPPPGNYDIGAAADIVSAGVNPAFPDGVVFFPTKYGIMYALDLTTGAMIWQYNFNEVAGATEGGLSAPSLIGNDLVFGYNGGMFDLNAVTGTEVWLYKDPTGTEVVAGPAVVGPATNNVVAFTNTAGIFRVIQRSNAAPLYSYQTGGYMTASPAYANGTFFVTSTDGFLYAFATGGSNGKPPTTAVTYPAAGASVPYGSGSVTVAGTATGATGIAAVDVAIQSGGSAGPWWDGASQSWVLGPYENPATVTPVSGGATWSLNLPLMPTGGVMTVSANAVATGNIADIVGATSSFSSQPGASEPVVTLASSIEPPGGTVSASATGFAPGETITFTLTEVSGPVTLGSAQADSSGNVAATALAIPKNAAFGPTALTATGGTSHKTSNALLDVENAWIGLGYDSTRASSEPNDIVLARVLHAGPGIFLRPAYFTPNPATAPVESSPAILDGFAFFGNDNGTMSAVDTQTGAAIWQWTTPSGMPIVSSPIIDNGYVIFGSNDGTLYGVSAATGQETGSIALGGSLTSPAVANGVVFVASKNGTVSAVSEKNGALLWQHNVGTNISGSVAVDAAGGLLLVDDDLGYVSAYALTTGTRVWHVEVGGALKVTPSVSGGVVYTGSTNGNVVALTEATGAKLWSYAEGSAITTTPSVAAGEGGFTGNAIYVGSADGTMTALNANGTKNYLIPFNINGASPIVGLASTLGDVVVVEQANGNVGAARVPNDGFNFYNFLTGASLDTAPAIVDGAVYVGSGAGGLYAFTPYGNEPLIRVKPGMSPRQRLLAVAPKTHWAAFTTTGLHAIDKSMIWSGKRDYTLHVLGALTRGTAAAVRFHGGVTQQAPRVYTVYWRPAGSMMSAAYHDATARWFAASKTAQLAGSYVDTSPFPARLSDAAFQREIARVAAVNHWPAGTNAQFVVLTAREAFGAWAGFCAYHSAVSGAPSGSPLVYAVVPYPSGASECGAAAGIKPTGTVDADLVLPTILREQTDVARDPLGTGWFDAAGHEAGDFLSR